MHQDTIVNFTTYGPNRGLTLHIGNFQFVEGSCEVPANEASAAASILCRYHDVCPAHELEQKIAEYDTANQNRIAATGDFPPATANFNESKPDAEPTRQPEPQTPAEAESKAKSDEPQLFDAPAEEPAPQAQAPQGEAPSAEGSPAPVVEAEAETKKPQGGGKKNSGKQTQA